MKKMVVTLSILASTLGLAGCGTEEKVATTKSNNETSKQVQKVEENGKQTVKSELNKEKIMGGIAITPQSFQAIQDDSINTDTDQLVKVTVNVKNNSKQETGISSAPFFLKSKGGKELQFYGELNEFGTTIAPGKSVKGEIYYIADKKATDYELIYNPSAITNEKDTKQRNLSWELEVLTK
ncbi:DUF4352 domain-containing protein [Paenilisteria rocourtiae]|uniref:Uncharacterized protein DUF4352 n=2 Tax=Listeria rocourtiae TaxID=647910 RepID=A0A4R6ZLK7_9LIST|nr:DUF4352 domain-containing protein [Listeria rocourtiae]MBC1604762.1 DUF4352 domain-containing protein [Listeria rocourtiae]TDR53152.1 uncharacterized protein DUF4352 [Listeria rocourtiae]